MHMFPRYGYNFVYNNRIYGKGSVVALYLKDTFHFQVRDDLTVNHDTEFESVVVEIGHDKDTLLIWEAYGVPGTKDKGDVIISEFQLYER